MCILQGFPTTLAKSSTGVSYPFGIWFANPNTLYVADEGNGDNTYSAASGSTPAPPPRPRPGCRSGCSTLPPAAGTSPTRCRPASSSASPYTVAGYPIGDNAATGLPWAPATDGLRNITGRVNRDGTATIWAVTSTVSGGGDQGADPNQLVAITDSPSATTPAAGESFQTVLAAGLRQGGARGVVHAGHRQRCPQWMGHEGTASRRRPGEARRPLTIRRRRGRGAIGTS